MGAAAASLEAPNPMSWEFWPGDRGTPTSLAAFSPPLSRLTRHSGAIIRELLQIRPCVGRRRAGDLGGAHVPFAGCLRTARVPLTRRSLAARVPRTHSPKRVQEPRMAQSVATCSRAPFRSRPHGEGQRRLERQRREQRKRCMWRALPVCAPQRTHSALRGAAASPEAGATATGGAPPTPPAAPQRRAPRSRRPAPLRELCVWGLGPPPPTPARAPRPHQRGREAQGLAPGTAPCGAWAAHEAAQSRRRPPRQRRWRARHLPRRRPLPLLAGWDAARTRATDRAPTGVLRPRLDRQRPRRELVPTHEPGHPEERLAAPPDAEASRSPHPRCMA